jgi:hypothetical protein
MRSVRSQLVVSLNSVAVFHYSQLAYFDCGCLPCSYELDKELLPAHPGVTKIRAILIFP